MTDEEEIKSFKSRFIAAQEAVEIAIAGGDAETIRVAAEEMMRIAEDDTVNYYPQQFDGEFAACESVMLKIPEALHVCGWSSVDVIDWVLKISRPSAWLYSFPLYDSIVMNPSGEYANPVVWGAVAERLLQELSDFREEQLEEAPSDGASQLWEIREALKKAGDEPRAIDYWVRYVPKIKNWRETVEFLNKFGRYDEAVEVARRGIKESRFGDGYENDYAELMMEPLADAFSSKGDHLKAAAILAEQFLHWLGAYESHRSVESFNKVLEEADKAGVREETRIAILHALKTGVNPAPLCDWNVTAPVQEYEWRPVPKLVVYRAYDARQKIPKWPLPRSNEGLKFPNLRWETMKQWCQQDQEFLLKLDLAEGDKYAIANRFDDLPEFPHNYGFPCSDEKLAMLDAVAAAVADIRPDIAEKIRVQPNRSNLRGVMPRQAREEGGGRPRAPK